MTRLRADSAAFADDLDPSEMDGARRRPQGEAARSSQTWTEAAAEEQDLNAFVPLRHREAVNQ